MTLAGAAKRIVLVLAAFAFGILVAVPLWLHWYRVIREFWMG